MGHARGDPHLVRKSRSVRPHSALPRSQCRYFLTPGGTLKRVA
jgi:hypothetical protein